MLFLLLSAVVALTTICALTVLEGPARNRMQNLWCYALWLVSSAAVTPLLWLPIYWLGISPLIRAEHLPFGVALILYVLVVDLNIYLFHRAQHAIPALWKLHSLHHSDREMNASTTVRHFWGDPILRGITTGPLIILIIQPTPMLVIAYAVIGSWDYFSHSSLRIEWGRWSWIINSPAYHRLHHSAEPAHYNSNFCALLPIWDVLFGTYRRPQGFPKTGLDFEVEGIVAVSVWPLRPTGFGDKLTS